ncbi:related to cell cycle control protein cwf15 [Ustilago sp. UG-2017a]|nr:related to cell cycle control protein cwf15 [Ustilago sp. UG-2017a]
MSTAHRPNFDPAKGRQSTAHLSAQTSKLDIPSYTKLKFRQPRPTCSCSSVASSSIASTSGRRDLKRDLELAEWEATNRKRAKSGLEPLPAPMTVKAEGEEREGEEERNRKEAIVRAIELDRDSETSSDDEAEQEEEEETKPKQEDQEAPSSEESDSDSDEDSEEDEQALLLRELQKIRAERAAAKQRQTQLNSTSAQLKRQEEIARGNPLLNLENAFAPTSHKSPARKEEVEEGFEARKRWDDDVIFKNQASAAGNTGRANGAANGFVNDLTRSDFHTKFMNRYIK